MGMGLHEVFKYNVVMGMGLHDGIQIQCGHGYGVA